jgi:phosphatidate cytidylyltransferase
VTADGRRASAPMDADTPDDGLDDGVDDLALLADDDLDAEGSRRDQHTGSLGRNLPVAIASGLVMVALFLTTLFLSPVAFLAFIAVLIVIGLLELDGAFRGHGLRPATPVAIGAGLVMHFGALAGGASAQALGLVLAVLGTLAWVLLDPGGRAADPVPAAGDDAGDGAPAAPARLGTGRVTGSVGATFLMVLWVPFLASFIALLLARDDGPWYVMAAVSLAVTMDISAFAWGSRFGQHKMAPSVSPGKTWEGFVGGIATVLLLSALVTARVPGFDLRTAVVFGLAVAVMATVGDLAESLVKRDMGVKDLGTIVPGHGGIMDRVDAIVFALPTAHLVLLALGS